MMMSPSWKIISYAAIAFFFFFCCVNSQPFNYDHPTANLSSKWINAFNNSNSKKLPYSIRDDYTFRPILVRALPKELLSSPDTNLSYACGFYCSDDNPGSCLFSVSIVHISERDGLVYFGSPQVVWSANRNNPVGENATVELTTDGALILRDENGKTVWSTDTGGKGLNLTEMGNLLLFDGNHSVIWQSFDHPTNCLIAGQRLLSGMNLTADASPTNRSAGYISECGYPKVCGEYGICKNGQCSCPGPSFRQRDDRLANLGCSEVIPLTCNASANHTFLKLENATYFTFNSGYADYVPNISNTDIDRCEEECLKNCSCKAAIFMYESNSSDGYCYLLTNILSLMMSDEYSFNCSVSLKMETPTPANGPSTVETPQISAKGKTSLLKPVLGSALGVFLVIVMIGITLFVYRRRKRKADEAGVPDEDYLDRVPGMPTRFSFEELAAATYDFTNKLGEGGFGSVYEGALSDGTKIAVKRLDGVGHIKKSFLAEVESIGNIHHINLVRLLGFCAEKCHRLLVYEYMCNGSLEKWIYSGSHGRSLNWNKRRKIILDVAKGLSYLHEDCRQKIIHLDIKPQNILLDEHYNAKLADFGLSKLVDRDQSHVVTTMRGTPGYLAPEWLEAIITEKLDVYSFGVVVLEILTGRKIFEQSRPEEERHLLTFFKRKAEEGKRLDLVDECCEADQCDLEEAEKMMQMSAWCLQSDHEKRPSMSMVIKVMEGGKDVPQDIDCNLLIPRYLSGKTSESSSSKDATPLLPLLLSGPR